MNTFRRHGTLNGIKIYDWNFVAVEIPIHYPADNGSIIDLDADNLWFEQVGREKSNFQWDS